MDNAGFTRDRMLFNKTDEEWDQVLRVHLCGHFLLSRNAAAYWRELAKQKAGRSTAGSPTPRRRRSSGSPGQPDYAAAKAGITALTLSEARGGGIWVNSVHPGMVDTGMTRQYAGEEA